jgi:hypothetical protein
MNQTRGLHTVAIDDRLHRVTVREACADEGGVPHEPALAKPRAYRNDPIPALAAAVLLVAVCCAIALLGFKLYRLHMPAELPRATAKVTT